VNRRLLREERGLILLPSLLRIVAVLLVLGLIGIETSTVVFNRLQIQDTAEQAAFEAAGEYQRSRDVTSAREAAELRVVERDPRAVLRQFEVRTDGSVAVVVFRRAHTLFIHRIDFFKGLTGARGRSVQRPPPA
jgi:uncharacterized membrane protein